MGPHPTNVREFLHYVPYFQGKTFVLDLTWGSLSESGKAEVLMDLRSLQMIGVRLVLFLDRGSREKFWDWAVDLELRTAVVEDGELEAVNGVIGRGQMAVMERDGEILGEEVVTLAVDLNASKILALADCGILKSSGEVIKFLRVSEVDRVDEFGGAASRELLDRAVRACGRGVKRVHLLDSKMPGVLLDELFSNEGVGTMVYADSYREIRALREEDVSELLGMIGRSVRNTHLVPRSYEEISERLSDYAVMEVDDHVVGCVALYRYADIGEIACLYVKRTHVGTGHGADLVKHMEERARSEGLPGVFALTNRAATFFEQLGYEEMDVEMLPRERLEVLRASGRQSRAFLKRL